MENFASRTGSSTSHEVFDETLLDVEVKIVFLSPSRDIKKTGALTEQRIYTDSLFILDCEYIWPSNA